MYSKIETLTRRSQAKLEQHIGELELSAAPSAITPELTGAMMRELTDTPFFLSPQFKPLIRALAILGGSISACLTIQFCIALGGRGVSLLPILLGIFCEGLKLTAIGAGLWLIHGETWREQITGWASITIAAVLIVGSIAASMGYLVQKDARSRSEVWKASAEHQDLTQQKKSLLSQIQASEETAKQYRDHGRITLSTQYDVIARELNQKLNTVMALLVASEAAITTSSDFFSGLATMIAIPDEDHTTAITRSSSIAIMADRIRMIAYFVLAIILELGCVLAVQLLHLGRSPRSQGLRSTDKIAIIEKPIPRSRKPAILVQTQDYYRDQHGSLAERYEQVRAAVVSGELDPAYRPVRSTFALRQQTTTQFFRQLENDGVIVRRGRGFVLASDIAFPQEKSAMGFC